MGFLTPQTTFGMTDIGFSVGVLVWRELRAAGQSVGRLEEEEMLTRLSGLRGWLALL